MSYRSCFECKHFFMRDWSLFSKAALCSRVNKEGGKDIVTGERYPLIQVPFCTIVRENELLCGVAGVWFEQVTP